MLPVTAEAALTELLVLMRRSFAQYLEYAHPFARSSDGERLLVLGDIVADQSMMADRAADQLTALGAIPPSVEFPMEFTGTHDLSMGYLIDRAIEYQQSDIERLRHLSEALPRHQSIRSLVDESRGMAIAHLEALEECRRST